MVITQAFFEMTFELHQCSETVCYNKKYSLISVLCPSVPCLLCIWSYLPNCVLQLLGMETLTHLTQNFQLLPAKCIPLFLVCGILPLTSEAQIPVYFLFPLLFTFHIPCIPCACKGISSDITTSCCAATWCKLLPFLLDLGGPS